MAGFLPSPVPSFQTGFRLMPGGEAQRLVDLVSSAQAGLTALAGGAQAGSPVLNSALCEVTTVASANDSVQLPPAKAGYSLDVRNATATSMQVFGNQALTDTINGTAGATGIAVAANKSVRFWCPVDGKWYSNLSA